MEGIVKGMGMRRRKAKDDIEDPMRQLATRIPKDLMMRLKRYCVDTEQPLYLVMRDALREALEARTKRGKLRAVGS